MCSELRLYTAGSGSSVVSRWIATLELCVQNGGLGKGDLDILGNLRPAPKEEETALLTSSDTNESRAQLKNEGVRPQNERGVPRPTRENKSARHSGSVALNKSGREQKECA